MSHRLRSIWSLVWLLPAVIIGAAATAAPPRSLGLDITSARTLDAAQLKRIDDYVSYWVDELGAGEAAPADRAAAVERARQELVEPLGQLRNPSEAFRFEYGKRVLDGLTAHNVLGGNDPHRAVNAILVATELGTSKALRELVRHAGDREPRPYIRQRAAIGCMIILDAATAQPARLIIEKRDVDAAVRSLRDAASREQNPVVMRRQFEAILAVDDPKARDHLTQALDAVVKRLSEQQAVPSPLLEPIHVVVLRLRDEFLNLTSGSDQRALGTKIAPSLAQLLATIEGQWQVAQNEGGAKETYSEIIELCEAFLKRIHAEVQDGRGAPPGGLKDAWDRGDQPKYRADLDAWMEQLSRPPYRNG